MVSKSAETELMKDGPPTFVPYKVTKSDGQTVPLRNGCEVPAIQCLVGKTVDVFTFEEVIRGTTDNLVVRAVSCDQPVLDRLL